MKNTDRVVYVIHAEDTGAMEIGEKETYAIAETRHIAQQIAKTDEADGQIYPGWTITKMKLNSAA